MLIKDTPFPRVPSVYSYTFLPETETDRCCVEDHVSFSNTTPDPISLNSARCLAVNCISYFAIRDQKMNITLLFTCKMTPPPTSKAGRPYPDTAKGWKKLYLETIESVCISKWVFMSPHIFFSAVRHLCVLLFPATAINTINTRPVSVHK